MDPTLGAIVIGRVVAAVTALVGVSPGTALGQQPVAPPDSALKYETSARLDRADLEAWLDGYMVRALGEAALAGAVIVVVKDGRVLLQKGYGFADVANRRPVDPERTLFRAGSVSKLFTGTAVLQLVEQGKLDLDQDVNAYLDFAIPPMSGAPITLRNILTHTTGFEDVLKQLIVVDPARAEALDVYVKRHVPRRVFPPGATPAYSNYGVALAGYIVQRVSGESFDTYIERHIFGPLGMAHSTFRQPLPPPLARDMAAGYLDPLASPRAFSIYGPAPAGSLSSTGADMARFMVAHLQDGRYGEARILEPASARLMRARAAGASPTLNGMGLTFWEHDRNGHRIVGHDGGDPTFRSNLRLFPDDGVGLFMSFNAIGPNGGVFAVRSVLLDEFIDRYFPGTPREEQTTPTAVSHAQLSRGIYEPSDRKASFLGVLGFLDQAEVTASGDGTIAISSLTDLNGRPKLWREVGDWIWSEVGGWDRLAMTVEDGRVTRIARGGDPAGILLRVPLWRSIAVPVLVAAVLVLALAVLAWPAGALIRRRYRRSSMMSGRQLLAYRLVRVVALVDLGFLAGWGLLFQRLAAGEAELFSNRLDPWLRILQTLGAVGAVGTAVAVWNLIFVWRSGRGRLARASSLALVLACGAFVWFGLATHLLSQSLRY
ncbi:MAG: serine hydrolase domain-containing protein [Gemmatimonadota bacterium]